VSEVALGAMTFSDRGLTWGASIEDARAIFETFADAGGTFVDTANIYGDNPGGEQHSSERVLGDLLAADRDHFVVATKYTSSNTFDVSRSGNSLKSMRESVDGSLRALRTDHIDLMWLHTWDATTPVDEVLRGVNQLVTAGKILYFGFSDTPAWVVSHAAATADARGWTPPIAIQVEYSLSQRTPERDLVPMAGALDLGVTAWSPLAGGRLTGKYVGAHPTAETHRLADSAFTELEAPGGERPDVAANAVIEVAAKIDRPPSHVALAWLRRRGAIPILGGRRPEQIRENLGFLDLHLEPEQLDVLDAATAPSLGFPHDFLASDMVRSYSTSGHYDRLDNHRVRT
jgi:aryl-alcohol dehydrogenase-like predicted oxidoreductase